MFRITVEQFMDAAHSLKGYQGKCEAVHGHRYRVSATLKAGGQDEIGLSYDFSEVKSRLRDILGRYDHTYLNDIPPFDGVNPSAENIARAVYDELKGKLSGEPVVLECVSVWETPEQGVEYREG
jgi:6-pyruvoyltetrahydropterin/6-carboxytetrahydropterin synthase